MKNKQYVYVLNKNGEPLMPCSPSKARKLLASKKAKVRYRDPFTIQLLYGSSGYVQDIYLGVDTGSQNIGLSACTERAELFSAHVVIRDDVVKKISVRRELRQNRRSNKKRYRAARWRNRKTSLKSGWLPPSTQVKI